MNVRHALVAALLATTAIAAPAPALSETLDVQRFGVYVLVDDIDRSVAFYQGLFGEPPQVRTAALVGFDVAGALFGLADRADYGVTAAKGNSVRPYIKVVDLDAAFAHVRALAPDRIEAPGIINEGSFRFFRFIDPDGNSIELFSFGR